MMNTIARSTARSAIHISKRRNISGIPTSRLSSSVCCCHSNDDAELEKRTNKRSSVVAGGNTSSLAYTAGTMNTSPNIFAGSTMTRKQQQQQQHQRTMVTVTKTKSSDVLENDMMMMSSEDNSTTTNADTTGAVEYVRQSEELIVTDSCLKRVEKLIQQRKQKNDTDDDGTYFLRVFVDAGGCSGFQYQFEIASDYDEDEDIVIISEGASNEPRIVVDETSLGFLNGSTLDYVMEMIRSAFTIRDNPKSESACGCGSSFAVKNFESNPALD